MLLETNAFGTAAGRTGFAFAQVGFNNAEKTGTIAEEIDVHPDSDA